MLVRTLAAVRRERLQSRTNVFVFAGQLSADVRRGTARLRKDLNARRGEEERVGGGRRTRGGESVSWGMEVFSTETVHLGHSTVE